MSIDELEREIESLRLLLRDKEELLVNLKRKKGVETADQEKLTNSEISRYSRQIILPEIGVKGQLALKRSSILIVGAGGLGGLTQVFT